MRITLGRKFLEIKFASTEIIVTDNLMEDDSIISVRTDKKKRNRKIKKQIGISMIHFAEVKEFLCQNS